MNIYPDFVVHKVEIKGNNNYTRAYILGKLKLQEGDKINYKDLATKISYLSATDNFKIIKFHVKNTPDGKNIQ